MIRVTIELLPFGIDALKKHMATIEIANDIEQTAATSGKKGTYVARFSRISQHDEHLGFYDRTGTVKNIARNRSGAVYRILHGVLADFLDVD
jgi:hypothetical protein